MPQLDTAEHSSKYSVAGTRFERVMATAYETALVTWPYPQLIIYYLNSGAAGGTRTHKVTRSKRVSCTDSHYLPGHCLVPELRFELRHEQILNLPPLPIGLYGHC